MKLSTLLVLCGALWCHQCGETAAAPPPPFKPSQPLASPLDPSDQRAIAYLEREAAREKRGSASGSGDILKHLTHSIGQGIKNKIGQIAKSSAGASAYFSKSSSGYHHGPPEHGHGYGVPPPHPPTHFYPTHGYHQHGHEDKGVDIWGLKKSVLYTLLQAVKAIKGGVIAIKGQLIKGGGHLLTAKGKLIRGGGEALTSLGKNIALSAFHWTPHAEEEVVVHEAPPAEEHPSAGYGYSAPSAPGHDISPSGYGPPSGGGGYYYNSVHDGKPAVPHHDGLIILRKIPKHLRHPADSDGDHTNDDHEHNHPHLQQHQHQHEEAHHQQPYQQYQHQHLPHPHAHEPDHDHEQQDVQESQKTPAFKPLSAGIVPKMKNLVTSVFQTSMHAPPAGHPRPATPHKHPDTVPSHSQYVRFNVGQNTGSHPLGKGAASTSKGNEKVRPQQANIGTLINYLEHIRAQQKGKAKGTQHASGQPKGQPEQVYVTPTPHVEPKPGKLDQPEPSPQKVAPQVVASAKPAEATPHDLRQEQLLLEQQLQQLATLQTLQHQLHLINPYAADLSQGQHPDHFQTQAHLLPRPFPTGQPDNLVDLSGHPQGPVVIDLPSDVDLAAALAQYQIVPEVPPEHIHQTQIQIAQLPQHPIQEQPQHHSQQMQVQAIPQYLEDPMLEAESSNINAFLIHVPDADGPEEDRSLRPKSKRHLRPPHHPPSGSKLKKFSQLQQMQLMQQQLHHHQQQQPHLKSFKASKSLSSSSSSSASANKHSKRSPILDVVRSISFEVGPGGIITTNH